MTQRDIIETHVNLDHHIPSAPLMSTTEYKRVPKSEEAQLHRKDNLEYRDFLPDAAGVGIWERLRKPEFQRATNGWDDDKVLNLLKTLRNNQVIPGVILWLNTETSHIFVLDGAHRLSVIRAWATNDWGDSEAARQYGYVGATETAAAARLRKAVSDKIGSHEACQDAAKKFRRWVDGNKSPEIVLSGDDESRGRFMYNLNTSLRIPIQWVTGDYETAEQSFININTGGTALSTQEVDFLKNRRSPVARAINGIVSNGSRPGLWMQHGEECEGMCKVLYSALLAPSDNTFPERVESYPICVLKKQRNFDRYLFVQNVMTVAMFGETGEDKLRKGIRELADEEDDAVVASKALGHLKSTWDLISNVSGSQSQSLGLYPAFYFYTNKGHYKDFLFLLFLAWLAAENDAEGRMAKKIKFTFCRDMFEEAWMLGKEWIFKAFGRKGAGPSRLTGAHADTLQQLVERASEAKLRSGTATDVLDQFLKIQDAKIHSDFMKELKPSRGRGKIGGHFSAQTKTHGEFLTLFNDAHRCEICGGRVLLGSHQVDHVVDRAKGGTGDVSNAAFVHPFCNNNKDRLKTIRRIAVPAAAPIGSVPNKPPITLPAPQPDTDRAGQLGFGW